MSIYQDLWNADQEGNGIKPILRNDKRDEDHGYVVVDEQSIADPDHRLFQELYIPNRKTKTYQLAKKLFNNYTLDQSKREKNTVEEQEEVEAFLEAILDTPVMEVARKFVASQTNKPFDQRRWYQLIRELWFTTYGMGGSPELSGFEHIVVGEQKKGKAGGYHFWYKYYLDDVVGISGADDIVYHGTAGQSQQVNLLVPEISTISYTWLAYDYEQEQRRRLFKKTGGFFNGCSVEGLMAIATVRGYFPARADKNALINGSLYGLEVHHNNPHDPKHLRTFYPVFKEIVDGQNMPQSPDPVVDDGLVSLPVKTPTGGVKIAAALVNPIGDDSGQETVTLVNTSPLDINVKGWKVQDRNRNTFALDYDTIGAGVFETITLQKNTVQLGNKGGNLQLLNAQGQEVHSVSYLREQVREQGVTLLF